MRVAMWSGGVLVVALWGLIAWLTLSPPDLLRVGSNFTAKTVCSNVFVAGRDAGEVLANDVQAPGHPLLRLMRIDVDETARSVTAGIFGFIATGRADFRGAGFGCSSRPDSVDLPVLTPVETPAMQPLPTDALWPQGSDVSAPQSDELDAVLNDMALIGPGMRAVVVVKDGRIIAERYGEGFDETTPLLGWSITKSVNAAILGRAMKVTGMTLDAPITEAVFGTIATDDPRNAITLGDLMGMASDLAWNEGYGSVSDVTRMLYLEPDMAQFAAARGLDAETPEGVGEAFEYSSGTSVLISRVWQSAVGFGADLTFPRAEFFNRLGMGSATLETDETGNFIGGSYMYATARDWARFGLFMAQRGVWNGRSLLPVGYVDWMAEPHPASNGRYGRGQVWLEAANSWMDVEAADLPDGSFFMNGHDGQSINVVPSENLVVVRLGLTPSSQQYQVANLVDAVLNALR
ncbi:MAG: serine hydrolase [Ahrensia sp.]